MQRQCAWLGFGVRVRVRVGARVPCCAAWQRALAGARGAREPEDVLREYHLAPTVVGLHHRQRLLEEELGLRRGVLPVHRARHAARLRLVRLDSVPRRHLLRLRLRRRLKLGVRLGVRLGARVRQRSEPRPTPPPCCTARVRGSRAPAAHAGRRVRMQGASVAATRARSMICGLLAFGDEPAAAPRRPL